ncbi:Uncharacterized protein involved in copper resistance [Pseudomonas sp. ok272]|uniref:copper resistance protein B n=1 Tax=unclassified Pseudomonas TaxID=196821 RepID=UPI0008D185AC|nr:MULTISPECIES: copper resistance protein B [unclassified Pseudomonas]SEM45252.1 Uncharacterized protein involved in copper resistance [Pseudomonas sp. ok272]SFM17001.1 Uncharacterized protein involved in copper resistance [Pseudomonas sp. ok602]
MLQPIKDFGSPGSRRSSRSRRPHGAWQTCNPRLSFLTTWAISADTAPSSLTGTEFDLWIGEAPANFNATPRNAMTINGGLPGPLLRWREGDTVTIRVRNRLTQDADDGSALAWDMSGWIGGEIGRLWLRAEGERSNGHTEKVQVQALWGHAIGPWWDVVSGVRQDFKPGAPHTWTAIGLQGLALYDFETQATFFIGENGQNALRVQGEYGIVLTNPLILQPSVEANFYTRTTLDAASVRGWPTPKPVCAYAIEVIPQFAPYTGVTWSSTYGNTADYTGLEGERRSEARFVAGLRLWF